MLTVHMIGNAHLDPVWLWRKPAGIVEAIATCRTAARLLEELPEWVFTRSDVWLYEQIESLDPELFGRIKAFVAGGRWHIAGGWYIQPDCNLPTAESFRRHMAIGKRYFREKFGVQVTVGYNVDSFGHSGMLPRLLADAGYDSYVMMRPNAVEKPLPSPLFRWQAPDGAEVLAWRIIESYAARAHDLSRQVQTAIDAALPGVEHVMCFFGVGDHGGGPTREQIRWIMSNKQAFSGARLEFSDPRRFFDAVSTQRGMFPIVRDELQYHAVGCYSVTREIKREIRQAEHRLVQAENVLARYPHLAPPDAQNQLEQAWKKVLFNQFHDILAGTSLAEAYADARDELGWARHVADELTSRALLRRMVDLEADGAQRIVVFNPSHVPFRGLLRHEPWLNWSSFAGSLLDEGGRSIAYQPIQSPATVKSGNMILWPAEIAGGAERVYRLKPDVEPEDAFATTDLIVSGDAVENSFWAARVGGGSGLVRIESRAGGSALFSEQAIELLVLEDPTDTWSHGVAGFSGPVKGRFRVNGYYVEEKGPLRAALRVQAVFAGSRLDIWVRLTADSPELEMELRLDWHEHLALAKLVFPLTGEFDERCDGVPGGAIERPQDGLEYPLMDWTLARGRTRGSDWSVGLVSPDCTSLDGAGNRLRFTLCRSPAFAWHDPARLEPGRFYQWTDQGEHRFRFAVSGQADPKSLRQRALVYHRPPLCFDWTLGMG